MKRQASQGHYFEKSGRGYYRLRIDGERPIFPFTIEPGPEADRRAKKIHAMVGDLRAHSQPSKVVRDLVRRAAAAVTREEFEAVAIVAGDVVSDEWEVEPEITAATSFDRLFELWVSGELFRLYPDHVRKMKPKTAADYRSLYRTYVKDAIGHLPIGSIKVEHALRTMRAVPADASSNSLRRNTAIVVTRPLRLAVFPVRAIEESPIPKGFLPKKKGGRAKVYLYPSEDRQVLACPRILLVVRLLYGLLAREGLRVQEALRLTISDLDLDNGILVLDENKTDEPRQWAMAEGTAEALRLYVKHLHPNPEPDQRLFVTTSEGHDPAYVRATLRFWLSRGMGTNALAKRLGVSGALVSFVVNGEKDAGPGLVKAFAKALSDRELPRAPAPPEGRTDTRPLVALARATEFRDNLKEAKLSRAQLFELSDSRRHIVIHDLRATFVTVSLAEGRSEAWITDRTGHTSSAMLYRYKRAARTHGELALGSLDRLDVAIPEIAKLARVGRSRPTERPTDLEDRARLTAGRAVKKARSARSAVGRVKAPAPGLEPSGDVASRALTRRNGSGPSVRSRDETPVGRPLANRDPVVDALAGAHHAAAAAGDWERAAVLAREIAARSEALGATNVVPIRPPGRRAER